MKTMGKYFFNRVSIKPNVEVILLILLPFRILAFTEEVSLRAVNNVRLVLLAPTGALILMMVRDISVAPAFSDFHSVHWCN